MYKNYKFKNKVWRWPGIGGWHFVYLEKDLVTKIIKEGQKYKYGSGFLAIKATIGKTTWDTALFPHTKEKTYLLSIKALVRKKEQIFEGDIVTVKFEFRKI